jgi:MinD-like ATPase involved in chromosome partitioning or flagellar assembly
VKSIGIIGNDKELLQKINNIEFFNDNVIDMDVENVKDKDILVISDKIFNPNELIQICEEDYILQKTIFYMNSEENSITENMESILCAKNIKIIPPKLTRNQIVERICTQAIEGVKTEKNIVTFFGADSKVGNTITTQAIAETLAEKTDAKIILLYLNGKPSIDYLNIKEYFQGLDTLKVKLLNKILSINELLDACIKKDNLYILPGANSIRDVRYYHPSNIENLIELASSHFDIVLIDAGSNIELGMTIASLNATKLKCLITTPQDSIRENFNRINEQILTKLNISDFMLIVNKYVDSDDMYSPSQLAELYNTTLLGYLPLLNLGWQCERDRKTLIYYEDKEYNNEIDKICKLIANQLHRDYKGTGEAIKKTWWKRLIS